MQRTDFRIGFVGVGRMGANIARRLKDEGFLLTAVHDIDESRSGSLARELDCEAVATPAAVAERSNTVLTVVSDDQAMKVIFDEQSPTSLVAYAQNRLFINCATVSPCIHVELERLVERYGGRSLEACMAGSIPQAREGTLYLLCAGKSEIFDEARPLLQSISVTVRYFGKAGEAAKVKAIVNMIMNINTAGLAEGLGLGLALGFDVNMLREVFAHTGAASRVLETDAGDMANRDHECYFSAVHAAKDSGIALKLAESEGLTFPLAKATFEQYNRLVELGKGELDKSAIAELTFRGRS